MSDDIELDLMRRRRDAAPDFGLFAAPPTTHPTSKSGTSQNAEILRWLRQGHGLTPLEALERFGCNRLAARVADLKAAGHAIVSELVTLANGKRVSRYTLEETR